MVSSRSATVPDHESSEAKASGSVVRKLIHHAGPRDGVGDGPGRQLRRDGHPVAYVAQPRARHRDVDRHQQRVVAGLGGAVDQRHRAVAVLPHVELEPVPAAGVRRGDVLDRGRAHRRQRERDPGRGGRCRARDLALGLHHPGEAGRRDPERQRDRPPSTSRDVSTVETSRRIDGTNSTSRERLPGAGQRDLRLGGAVGVVERGLRRAPLGDPTQVVDGQRLLEPPGLRPTSRAS